MSSPEPDPRVYFASERTLLAWVRTGLAIIGLGYSIQHHTSIKELPAKDRPTHYSRAFAPWVSISISVPGPVIAAYPITVRP